YIFDEQKGIHIIDLNKTIVKLEEASQAIKQVAKSGKKILFVATKKQAKEIITEKVANINMPFVVERWAGGTLTNFSTIRKSVKKMANIDKMGTDGTLATMSKRERLQVSRQRAKLDKNLGSIADMTRLPAALFVIDIKKEHIAVAEAKKLSIPVFAMVDTNSDPMAVDFPIPSNDDASKSIGKILDIVVAAIVEGLTERKADKAIEKAEESGEEVTEKKRDIVIAEEDDDTKGGKKGPRKGVGRKLND
ncbi:MAG TPA: 30S ribosomal protein S2, partial [Flavobacteriales bacterium]|nr:30S ribosomal protein S2 [Flavobacteriales bacterium]